jgi:hypothetical protein
MEESFVRLDRLVRNGVPADALAFYGRWWQLETWLREVVYLELRASFGREWEQRHLGVRAPGLAERDQINAYMASVDADDVLAYLDVFDLFSLIDKYWGLFEPSLLPHPRWRGLVDALRPLRNRIAHCRRPHPDDVDRIEQALRDLERGARCFYGAYVRTYGTGRYPKDPVVQGWVDGKHPDARRLLEHADRQYDVRFRLACSVRPWGELAEGETLSGTSGALWHATWSIGTGEVDPAKLWAALAGYRHARELLVHVLLSSPWEAEVTFAAVDDPTAVADAIGNCFDALLMYGRRASGPPNLDDADEAYKRWRREGEKLPGRVRVGELLSEFDPDAPYTIFAASRPAA